MRLLPLFLLAGCGQGVPLIWEHVSCVEEATEVTWEDDALGFTATELLALVGSSLRLELDWTEITFGDPTATIVVSIAADEGQAPSIVTRSDADDSPGGCEQGMGQPAGTYLRIPVALEARDPAGGLTFSNPGPFEDGAFELDAASAHLEDVWLDWEFGEEPPIEDILSGHWLTAAEACLYEHWGPDELSFDEARLILWGQADGGFADIELGGHTADANSLKACWRGVCGSASWD